MIANAKVPRIALTSGEPAGVGPDLSLAIARESLNCELVCLADRSLLAERAAALKLSVTLRDYDPRAPRAIHAPGTLNVLHVPLTTKSVAGKLDRANSRYVLNLIDRAIDGAQSGEFDAIVTAPVQKSVINEAGIPFTGHTEYLAERTRAPLPVMMLATEDLRVALATTHLPLKDVSAAITRRIAFQGASDPESRSEAVVGPRIASHLRVRPEPARGRKRSPRRRRDQGDLTRHRTDARPRPQRVRSCAGRYGVRSCPTR